VNAFASGGPVGWTLVRPAFTASHGEGCRHSWIDAQVLTPTGAQPRTLHATAAPCSF